MSDTAHSIIANQVAHEPRRALRQGVGLAALLVPLAIFATYAIAHSIGAARPDAAAALTAGICALGCIFILSGLAQKDHYPHSRLGLCNATTMLRGAGISVLAGLSLTPVAELGWALAILACAIMMLDALDGWAARQARLQSRFGARFDVETDVAFALTLTVLAIALGQVGAWFLLLGLLRPMFIIAGYLWRPLRAPLPDARWRKRMAGVQMGVQVLLVTPLLSPPLASWVAGMLLTAMALSFIIDIRWLAREARRP